MGPGIGLFPAIEKPHVSLAAERLFGTVITNSMLTMFLVMIGLVIFFALATRGMRTVPGGAQNLAEYIVEVLLNLVEGTAGKRLGRRIFPLIATLFIFIITANYTGLLPGVGTIGYNETEHGERILVPFFRAPNADFNMTIAMALISIVTVQVVGIAAHGAGGYLKEFINPIHLVGELSRIISLSARLFGNIFGGEVLLAVIIALTAPAIGVIGIIPAVFYGLEMFFGFIQALLFSLLTLIYIAVAAAGHGEHEEHGAAGAVEQGAEELAV